MHRRDLMRAVARATGESVSTVSGLGFQLENPIPLSIKLSDWPHWLHRAGRIRGQRRKRRRQRVARCSSVRSPLTQH